MTSPPAGAGSEARQTVLVVDADPGARARMVDWLSKDGFDVLACAGPGPPDYRCPWAYGDECFLPVLANAIVVSLWLGSDTVFRGNTGGDVLEYYRSLRKRVVALRAEGDVADPVPDERTAVLERPVARAELVDALRRLLRLPKQPPGDPVA